MNHLAYETSPYLLQHADNPVDWHPWGEAALTLAREQDKPILLSVGYSACHWCHVMAHESFEDESVAKLMNEHFINIKVDREERPDIDQIYQAAHAMLMRRSGGWPLTLFLTPQQQPYFGGTYFPKTPRHGLPGFADLLPRVAQVYHQKKDQIAEQSTSLAEAFAHSLPQHAADANAFTAQPIAGAVRELTGTLCPHGGFGGAPKFPHPVELEFCLRRYALDNDDQAKHAALLSLQKMALGGIYDHLGGGFSRYSVDKYWSIPHFEKMLYDNGPLLGLYSDAYLVSGDAANKARFASVVEETAAWVTREMTAPEGGYYSSIDADSEHEEGKFYVWQKHEVAALLAPQEYQVVAPYYGLNRGANFEHKDWHLEVTQPLSAVAQAVGITLQQAEALLASARQKLFAARALRVHPGRDDKILTSWNGLMIRGMARAGRIFGRDDWVASAMRAADFICAHLWKNNRLLATSKDGTAHLNAYLDDYAFLLNALLELMQAEFRQQDLAFAIALAEVLLAQFEDRNENKASGGFFFTSHDHEALIHRPKPGHDNATPSGNGVAAFALQRLGHLLGEARYLQAAEKTLALFYPALQQNPSLHCGLLNTLDESLNPPNIVILRGAKVRLRDWQQALRVDYWPHTLMFFLPVELENLPATLDKPLKPLPLPALDPAAAVNAWVCRGVTCMSAISDLEELRRACQPVSLSLRD